MIAYLLSPAGRIGRRAYAVPIGAFFAMAVISAFATGISASGSVLGYAFDSPWAAIGRAMDASALSALPVFVKGPLFIAVFTAAVWAGFILTIKRLHDLGASGWWSTLLAVPGAGVVLMLICAVAPGRPRPSLTAAR